MILIADSGSTKTNWRIIDAKGKVGQAQTKGINPYFQSTEEIQVELQESLQTSGGNKDQRDSFLWGRV